MSGVVVVTDSSTCLPIELEARFAIKVLPISARFGDDDIESFSKDDVSASQLLEAMELEELSGANHPFVTEYLDAIESEGYDSAVVITPAVEFATMYRNAVLATELASRPAVAIDARTAAAGQALIVLAASSAASRGATLEEVVGVVESASRRVELVATLSTFESIRRAGPVPEEVLQSAEQSGERSVFRMSDGAIELLGTTSDEDEALSLIARGYLTFSVDEIEYSTIFHAGAEDLARRLATLVGPVDFVSGFSVAMQVHTGRGVVGAAWLPGSRTA